MRKNEAIYVACSVSSIPIIRSRTVADRRVKVANRVWDATVAIAKVSC